MWKLSMGGGLLLTFSILTVLSGAAIIFASAKLEAFAYIVPIIFLFIAIGAFLLILLHYADTLQRLKPTMPVGALGLPDGSIRAFLTIGLLALVAVFGTFIYFESGKAAGHTVVRANVGVTSPEQLADLKSSVGERFVVVPLYDAKTKTLTGADVVTATADTSRADIAKQLLTTIATVLTTVIGFYFGSRVSEGAPGGSDTGARGAALGELSGWTAGLDTRQQRFDDLVARANRKPEAAEKVSALKARFAAAMATLGEAARTVANPPDDNQAVLAARDRAKQADADATGAETELKALAES